MANILLVEDDEMIRRMLNLRLSLQGHVVTSAENGRIGFEKALAGSYDLIMMDMHMPVMDGHEAVRQLRKQSYTGTIIAVTASALNQDSQRAIEAGCDYYISKPIGEGFEQKLLEILKDSSKPEA